MNRIMAVAVAISLVFAGNIGWAGDITTTTTHRNLSVLGTMNNATVYDEQGRIVQTITYDAKTRTQTVTQKDWTSGETTTQITKMDTLGRPTQTTTRVKDANGNNIPEKATNTYYSYDETGGVISGTYAQNSANDSTLMTPEKFASEVAILRQRMENLANATTPEAKATAQEQLRWSTDQLINAHTDQYASGCSNFSMSGAAYNGLSTAEKKAFCSFVLGGANPSGTEVTQMYNAIRTMPAGSRISFTNEGGGSSYNATLTIRQPNGDDTTHTYTDVRSGQPTQPDTTYTGGGYGASS